MMAVMVMMFCLFILLFLLTSLFGTHDRLYFGHWRWRSWFRNFFFNHHFVYQSWSLHLSRRAAQISSISPPKKILTGLTSRDQIVTKIKSFFFLPFNSTIKMTQYAGE
uniref:Putative secreted protein n=1 Tax=Panstrongylus lignarius TaxID=156445 RepID=A0A224Y117_9HEMI